MSAAIYGNYKGYQGATRATGQRLNAHLPDPRLSQLAQQHPQLLAGTRVLDIGCNAGRTAVDAAVHFAAASVVGLDRDEALIASAKSHLSFTYSRTPPAAHHANHASPASPAAAADDAAYFPISSVLEHHHIPYPPPTDPPTFPRNVVFRTENVLAPNSDLGHEIYDVILLLSVVKWLHIHGGDAGLARFWQRVVDALVPGGKLVVEWQPWESYEKARKKVPQLKERIAALKDRPEGFRAVLEGLGMRVVGRVKEGKEDGDGEEMEVDGGAGVGERRGIWVFEKMPTES
ncbi:Bicoid-interacting protein 3-domain-containing protein [Geopyxis carbonaria]|nr:Bicoid-interacting protein 3-domain-containing protein [Geopyxis carbonaria]